MSAQTTAQTTTTTHKSRKISQLHTRQLVLKQNGSFTKRIKTTVKLSSAAHLHCHVSEEERNRAPGPGVLL